VTFAYQKLQLVECSLYEKYKNLVDFSYFIRPIYLIIYRFFYILYIMEPYTNKYLKYKNKYLELKAGNLFNI